MKLRYATYALVLVVVVGCFLQFRRSVDFVGYIEVVRNSVQRHFGTPPYPVERARVGDYFQSPPVTIFLTPWALMPLGLAKLTWALLNLVGGAWLFRRFVRRPLRNREILFLVLLFTHPLSDVFLSGNLNFAMLVLLVAGWDALKHDAVGAQFWGAGLVALGIFVKAIPIYFVAWFVLTREITRAIKILVAMAALVGLSFAVMGGAALQWWAGWIHSLSIYSQAATPEWVAFQSPPAALYRFLVYGAKASPHVAFSIEKIFAALLTIVLYGAALWKKRGTRAQDDRSLAILIAILFLAGPFSWANAVMFTFPLVVLYMERGIAPIAWIATVALALMPKDLWPSSVWIKMAEASLPALCLMIVHATALTRLLRDPSGYPSLQKLPR